MFPAWIAPETKKLLVLLAGCFSLLFSMWTTAAAAQPITPPPSMVPEFPSMVVRPSKPPPEKPVSGPPGIPLQPSPGSIASGTQAQGAFSVQALACNPPAAPNEIVELARALKWNPDLIYEYVRNNIKSIPIYDSLKGPLGTLLDGAGTPVDQAELLFLLLQQSCFSPQYQIGLIHLTPTQMDKWLGTSTNGTPNQFYSIARILGSGGFCTSITVTLQCNGLAIRTADGTEQAPVVGADVPWIWVIVAINGTTYQYDPASKIVPNNGGDGYFPYSTGLGANFATALNYSQSDFLSGARAGASGIGTPVLNFTSTGRNNVRTKLTQYANNLASYIQGANGPTPVTASTTDIIGGATVQLLPTYVPPTSGSTLWGQTALPYQVGTPTTTTSLSGFRTTLTLTLGWNDANNNFTPLASPVTFNSADLHGHRLVTQFSPTQIASLVLDGVTQVTASSAVPSNYRLTLRTAIVHPHKPCASLPIPANCTGGPGSNIDNIRVTPAANAIFVVGNGWGGSNRGVVERHRKLLRQALLEGQPATSEMALGESLAMLGSSWLAALTRAQLVTGELTGTTVTYPHAIGIIGMKPVDASQGPYVDLPINIVGALQRVSRSSAVDALTPVESSAFFTTATIGSIFESATIEQTQPKDMNGQVTVAASTMKLLDIWSTAGTIYNLNDSTISGDNCSYYVANVRNNLTNFTAQDLARIDALIGYSAGTCSTPASTTQVVVPSNGQIAIGLWNGTGYLQILRSQDLTNVIGVGAIITGGLSGGESGSPVPADTTNENQSYGWKPSGSTDNYNNGSPSQIGNGNSSWLYDNLAISFGGAWAVQPSGGDPVNLVTGAYTYARQDIAVGSGSHPYALTFVRTYDSALGQVGINSSALGNGWMHNYDMTALVDSDVFEALGENSPISGAAGIAAIYVIQDILNLQTSNAKPADRIVIAAQIERWLSDQSTGNIVAVTQPGSIERFTLLPNAGGNNVYVPPLGSSSRLTDIAGGGYSYRLKTGETLTFNPPAAVASGRVTAWNSPSGASIVFSYDSNGKLQSVANPATQRQLNLHYTNQLLTSVDDNVGSSPRTVTFGYDSQSNLITVQDPLQQTTRFAYGSRGQLTQIVYPANPDTPFIAMAYDSLGRVSRQVDAGGNTSYLFFAGARSETIDPIGTAHVNYFSDRGRTLASIEGLGAANISSGAGNKTTFAYDGRDRLTLTTAPEGGTIGFTYSADFNNNVLTITRTPKPGSPLAPQDTTFSYDPVYNKPTHIVDPLGLVTSMSYDGSGNLISSISDVGASPHFNVRRSLTYNSIGQVVSATDPLGTVMRYDYDGSGNVTSIVRDAGTGRLNQQTSFTYGPQGDVIATTDPKGNTWTSSYDAARRLISVTAPNGLITTQTYDANSQLTQTQQFAGGVSLRSIGASYTLTGKTATSTDANGNVTSFAYDPLDHVSKLTDPSARVTTFGYDALGRQTSISNPAVQSTPLLQQAYTPDGRLASLTDANDRTTSFAYDGFDRLATTTYPLGSTETLTYDPDNNVLTRKSRAGQTITFTYDTLNRLATKTPPSPAPVVTYGYDLAGRPTSISDTSAAIAAAVPPSGSLVQYATTTSYDAMNRPTIVNWSPAPQAAATPAGSVTFGHSYNRANQRIGQTVTDNSWFNYPAATPSTTSYTANALNQYTAVGAVTPGYDGNGNLTSDGTLTLGYDAENRLTSASGAGSSASYGYDGRGRRKTKTVNGATTVFVTDADNREVLEYDGASGAVLRWYAYGLGSNDVLSQMNVAANTRATFVPDILGSIIGSHDSSLGTLSKIGYLPYGKSGSAGPFGFTGQRIDLETNGLYYYRARHYSPAWGRFMQPDPVGYSGGNNLYAYVGNDPLNQIDPDGVLAMQVAGALVGGAIGLGVQLGWDLYQGQLSSGSTYAGAIVGGAAGGVAATLCGPACAGAIASATSNVVRNGLNGTIDPVGFFAETAAGGLTGGVLGAVVPKIGVQFGVYYNTFKGDIGEGLSELGLRATGQSIVSRNYRTGFGRSEFDFELVGGYVESKFGTSVPKGSQAAAVAAYGNLVDVHYWTYATISGLLAGGATAGSSGSLAQK